MLAIFKRKRSEPVIEAEPVRIINWTEIDAGHMVGYPVTAHNADWRKYTVTLNVQGRWEVRWIMHRMDSEIGWTETREAGMLFAEQHHINEESGYQATWL